MTKLFEELGEENLVEMYLSGKSLRELEKIFRSGRRTLQKVLRSNGVDLRPSKIHSGVITKELLSELYLQKRLSMREISSSIGVSKSVLQYYFSKFNIEMRTRGADITLPESERKLRYGRHGVSHHKWKGGEREVACSNCEVEYTVPVYIYEQIIRGERQNFCSRRCHMLGDARFSGTSIERMVARELSFRGIDYVEQYVLNDKFCMDFYLPEYNIFIECDGDYWHNIPKVKSRDRSKNAYVSACGFRLFRFWESEIKTCVEACIDVVIAEINEREHLDTKGVVSN